MKHIHLPVALAVATAFCFGQAKANDFTYNYVSALYAQTNDRDSDFDPNGFSLMGGFALGDTMYVRSAFSSGSDSNSFLGQGVKIEVSGYAAYVGYRMPVSGQTEAVAEVGAGRSQVKSSVAGMSASESFTSFGAVLGLNHVFNSSFEGGVLTHYSRANKGTGSIVTVDFSGRYKMTERFHLVAHYSWSDVKVDNYALGISYAF